MSLSAEFDSSADRRAYALVAAGAAALSYYHARAFFLPFMGTAGATVTPLMMDAVVFWLAAANVRQARAGRPLPMLRLGAYGLLALTVTANALGGASLAERVFLALPAALFGFLVEARTRLALYQHRAAHGDDRLRVRLWLRHPARTFAAWLWLARQSAPAFDRASRRTGPAARRPRCGAAGPAGPVPGGAPGPGRGAAGTERRPAARRYRRGRLGAADPAGGARAAPGRAGRLPRRGPGHPGPAAGHGRGQRPGHPAATAAGHRAGQARPPPWPGCGPGTRT